MSRRLFSPMLVAGLLLAAAGLSQAPRVLAAPEPSIVPASWQVTFKHGNIERIVVPVNGKPQTYWYMRYTVVNNSGKDVLFTPEFELVTETGQVQPAFKDVPNDVFKQIKATYKNSYMESPTGILGKLLQGDDNARDGVIIFTDIDPAAREYQVFVAGLSGETAEVTNPLTNEPVILQKTLILDYAMPGQAVGIEPQPQLKAIRWVMK